MLKIVKQDTPMESKLNDMAYQESVESYVKHLIDRKRLASRLLNKDSYLSMDYGQNERVEKRWFNSEYDNRRPGWELAFGRRKRLVITSQ